MVRDLADLGKLKPKPTNKLIQSAEPWKCSSAETPRCFWRWECRVGLKAGDWVNVLCYEGLPFLHSIPSPSSSLQVSWLNQGCFAHRDSRHSWEWRNFLSNPMVKRFSLPMHESAGLILGWGAKTPHTSQPKN